MHGRLAGFAGVAAAVALVAPGVAGAATKTVQAGPFGPQAKQFVQGELPIGDANQFFRRTVTIHRGDSVRWKTNGFHNIMFVQGGVEEPPLIVPDMANPVADVRDASGALFWFNGQPNVSFNPEVALKSGGNRFDPDETLNSGLPLAPGEPPPYKLRFNQTGRFSYLCSVHPGMTGNVRVKRRGARIPSARRDKRAARRELARTVNAVKRLATGNNLNLTKAIQAGNDRSSGPTVFKFFPAESSFKVGDTATLQMPPSSSEVHTFTLGPPDYLGQIEESLLGEVLDPRGIYPSEPAPTPDFNGANHGNGYYNSGFLDSNPDSVLPERTQVRFTAAGTFNLVCLVHPFMTGTVTVTP
jgi:plastocyanin